MKAIKYLFIAALTAGYSAVAMAQDGSKADVDAVKKIISSKPADLDKQLKPYYKANRKNAENLLAIGRAFYEAKDTANAKAYANYALQASKNKCAPAFVLLGDIEAVSDNGGAAAAQYDQAIYVDPSLVEAYYKYALVYRKIDPRGAARKLDDLKAARPDVSVDAIKGHIFMIAGDRKSAYNEFKKVPVSQIDKDYLNEFARASYFGGHFEDALAACEEGLKYRPNNPTFTRLAMFSNYEMKHYDAAKKYLNKYFNELDKDNILVESYDNSSRQIEGMNKQVSEKSFKDAHLTFTEEQVRKETARCLGCGATIIDENKCIGCGVCTTKCEFDAITLHRDHPECTKMTPAEDKLKHILPYQIKRVGKIITHRK